MKKYQGKPCKACQNTERYTCNGNCVQCEKARHRLRYKSNGRSRGPIPGPPKHTFSVRLPTNIYKALVEKARVEKRSINAQVELLLEQSL